MPKPRQASFLPSGILPPMDLDEVSVNVVGRALESGHADMFTPIPTGLKSIDSRTGGGSHGGDLIVLGGVQNVGKTAAVLQIAGNSAKNGALSIVVCFEHSTQVMWERLLIQQSYEGKSVAHTTANDIRKAYVDIILERENNPSHKSDYINQLIGRVPNGARAWANLSKIQNNVWLVTGDSRYTSLEVMEAYIRMAAEYNKRILLMVDYIQRVPVFDLTRHFTAEERIDRVTQGLKSIALKMMDDGLVVPVWGVAAATGEALRDGRVHIEDLYGSSLLSYEPDLGIMMNKDPELTPEGFPNVRFSLEKNRRGPSDLEFKHRFIGSAYTFEEEGMLVSEAESWQAERRSSKSDQIVSATSDTEKTES